MENEALSTKNGDMGDDRSVDFAAERIRLEREAIAVERERLAAARIHAEAEARLAHTTHPLLSIFPVTLLSMLCFAGGLLTGIAMMENRQQRQREERLARALSHLDTLGADSSATNVSAVSVTSTNKVISGTHRNVSVVVIQ